MLVGLPFFDCLFRFFCGDIDGEDAVVAERERPGSGCGANPGGEEAVAAGWLSSRGGFGGFGCGSCRVWRDLGGGCRVWRDLGAALAGLYYIWILNITKISSLFALREAVEFWRVGA